MNRMKRKLMASMCMLLISAIMVTSTSFAWFTVSTAPTMSEIEFSMEATKNLEIARASNSEDGIYTAPGEVTANDGATAATKENFWGGTVTSFGEEGKCKVNFPATLYNGSTAGVLTSTSYLTTIKYEESGRTNGYVAKTAIEEQEIVNGYAPVYATTVFPDDPEKVVSIAGCYYVWLRTNVPGNVTGKVTGVSDEASIFGVMLSSAAATGSEGNYTVDATADNAFTNATLDEESGEFTIEMSANAPTLVKVTLFVDGTKVIAEDVSTDVEFGSDMSIAFVHEDVTTFEAQHTVPGGTVDATE